MPNRGMSIIRILMKSSCCKSYKKKGKSCKDCPIVCGMKKKKRKKFLLKFKKVA